VPCAINTFLSIMQPLLQLASKSTSIKHAALFLLSLSTGLLALDLQRRQCHTQLFQLLAQRSQVLPLLVCLSHELAGTAWSE